MPPLLASARMAPNSNQQRLHAQSFTLSAEHQLVAGCLVSAGFEHFTHFVEDLDNWLHSDEKLYYGILTAKQRQTSYLLGRISAKRALLELAPNHAYTSINICMGAFKDPIPHFLCDRPLQVGITHSSTMAAALAFPATQPMAIDMEDLDSRRAQTMKKHCDPKEWNDMDASDMDPTLLYSILWTAKEAVAKVLRIGLTSPLELMAVRGLQTHPEGGWTGFYQQFTQYQFHTWLIDQRVVSIVFPKKSRLLFPEKTPILTSL
jgi:4'-phosphopantetheinyl transferase